VALTLRVHVDVLTRSDSCSTGRRPRADRRYSVPSGRVTKITPPVADRGRLQHDPGAEVVLALAVLGTAVTLQSAAMARATTRRSVS